MLLKGIFMVSKRFFGVPSFFNYGIADGICNLPLLDEKGLHWAKETGINEFQLGFDFG
jgi:hypothetical protein